MQRYEIIDEPQPSGLSRFSVNPLWPLLAIMFGGAWLSWPWFAFNSICLGSPTRKKEIGLAVLGFVGAFVIFFGVLWMLGAGIIPQGAVSYFILCLVIWKLGVSYVLYNLQGQTFGLYEHFGGVVKNGLFVVVLGYFGWDRLLEPEIVERLPLLRYILN